MPSCPKCGKKFSTLQALNDHFRSVHPNEKFVPPKQASSARILIVIIVIVLIAVGSGAGYLIYTQSNNTSTTTTAVCTSCIGEAVSNALYQNLSGVSASTLNTIGSGQGVTAPTSISGASLLTNDGKPEVLYIGGDYCPYCAAERWALIVALSKFGTFANLSLMLSSPSDSAGANIATFTFTNSSYTSSYVSFVPIEAYDRSGNQIQTIPAADSALQSKYDSGLSIPFVDLGNLYYAVGAQYLPQVLFTGDSLSGSPYNWTQIGSQLDNPSSSIAKAIDGTANTLVSAICKMTSGNPSSVCGQSYASSLAIIPGISGSPSSIVVPLSREARLD